MLSPKWSRELARFLPAKAQFILWGNIHDVYPIQIQDNVTTLKMGAFLNATLREQGYSLVVKYEPLVGFTLMQDSSAETFKELTGLSCDGTAAANATLPKAAEAIEKLVKAKDINCAVLLNFASRIPDLCAGNGNDVNEFFYHMFRLMGEAAPKRTQGKDGTPVTLYSPVLWILDKENDLPSWYALSNARLRSLPIPKPDHDIRRYIVESIASKIDGYDAASDEQKRLVKELMGKAQKLASEAAQANALSLDGLVEEIAFIPPVVDENAEEAEGALKASMIQDICDFGSRVAFFNENEADRLKPLVIEAKHGADSARLKLIRSQIKTTYGRLREQAVLTDMFKQDIRDFLPPMRKAKDMEKLCLRMEDLLTAPVITREEYNDIYKAVKGVFEEQMETITDALFAEMIEKKLTGMGYELMDEQGAPATLEAGEMRLLSTPYDGYKVRVKVNKNNTIATRLVRVVGSEEEKASVSEYQRQQDVETGKKWCHDLDKFYKAMEDEGLPMKTIMRKEPEEEPLDIIVDKSVQKQRRTAAVEQRHWIEKRREDHV